MTNYADVESYLAHHGIKGMRWGVRKDDRVQTKAQKVINDLGLSNQLSVGSKSGSSGSKLDGNKFPDPNVMLSGVQKDRFGPKNGSTYSSRAAMEKDLWPNGPTDDPKLRTSFPADKPGYTRHEIVVYDNSKIGSDGHGQKDNSHFEDRFIYTKDTPEAKQVSDFLSRVKNDPNPHDEGVPLNKNDKEWFHESTLGPDGSHIGISGYFTKFGLGYEKHSNGDKVLDLENGNQIGFTRDGRRVPLNQLAAYSAYNSTAVGSSSRRSAAKTIAKAAFKYGVTPTAHVLGLGLPVIVGVGLTTRILSDPAVQGIISDAKSKVSDLLTQVGNNSSSSVSNHPGGMFNPNAKLDTSRMQSR